MRMLKLMQLWTTLTKCLDYVKADNNNYKGRMSLLNECTFNRRKQFQPHSTLFSLSTVRFSWSFLWSFPNQEKFFWMGFFGFFYTFLFLFQASPSILFTFFIFVCSFLLHFLALLPNILPIFSEKNQKKNWISLFLTFF